MSENTVAFSEDIKDGLIRIFLKIDTIECEVENSAPDFINIEDANPVLRVEPESSTVESFEIFDKSFPLKINERETNPPQYVYELVEGGLWFDLELDDVKNVWMTDFNFYIESDQPRYLSFYINSLKHKLEWLQVDQNTGEIIVICENKKKFDPPALKGNESYSGTDVLKCTDMLSRAIQKIDLRTRGAMVKFNTEKGRLEPLIIGMAEKLGYEIEQINREQIRDFEQKGQNVSHFIRLKEQKSYLS